MPPGPPLPLEDAAADMADGESSARVSSFGGAAAAASRGPPAALGPFILLRLPRRMPRASFPTCRLPNI